MLSLMEGIMRTGGLKFAIIAAFVGVSAPALADIDTDMSRAHITAISGQQGDTTDTAHGARLQYVYVVERGDKPCRLLVAHVDSSTGVDQCFGPTALTDRWTVHVPNRRVVGIQPCFNRRSGRLKGMRVFYDDAPGEGVVAEIQPNCRGNRADWGNRINCPEGYGGFGIRAHFTELPGNRANPIIGVQLICGVDE